MPELETRLARERADLLDSIEQPPLPLLAARAATIRHRRRARRAGAALAVVAVAGFAALRPWSTDAEPPPVAEPSPGVVYTDAGITINGLTGDGFLDLRGYVTDVEFTDPDHGYALVQCPAEGEPCPPSLARTTDGGITWHPATTPPGGALDVTAFPDGRIAAGGYVSADSAQTWRAAPPPPGPATRVERGELLRLGDGRVEVWSSTYGDRGTLVTQPPGLTVRWVAGAPAADGAWWVGGTRGGTPAVAVTRDGGTTWDVEALGAAGSTAQVATLDDTVYATVLGPDRELTAIFMSTDAGRTFTRTATDPGGGLAGELVPLLDGRLLVTGTDRRWYLSEDRGRTFAQADGTLPAVGRIARTTAGYVAYDLFNSGWAAFSADGSTWRKLQVN